MIYGIGTDNEEVSRIAKALERNEKFAQRVLTDAELLEFESYTSLHRRAEFVAGRWTAKEAYSKAFGTGIGNHLSFKDLEIAKNDKGRPYFAKHPFEGTAHLSISHSSIVATAMVVLEK